MSLKYKNFLRKHIARLENYKQNSKLHIKTLIEEYKLPKDHPEIKLYQMFIENYNKRIYENQMELGILAEKGRF